MPVRHAGLAVLTLALSPLHASADVGAGSADPVPTQLEDLQHKLAAQQAELAELKANQELAAAAEDPVAKQPMFDLHGFIDMGLQKLWTNDDVSFETTKSTFVLGNVNIYFTFHPVDHWSALAEIRFTNQPGGAGTVGAEVVDPANGIGDDTVRLGSIILERAYLQWQRSQALGIRVGQFLTPFGIWNADHGTPTVIPIVRPESMTEQLFPGRQLGVEVFGELDDLLPGRWGLEYHAYVSNGRTPGQVDLTEDKMIGGRIVAATTRPRRMAFGISAMYGGYSEQERSTDAADHVTRIETVAYREAGLSCDASIDLGALRLRGELTVRDLDYRQGKRAQLAAGVYTADAHQSDLYLLAAYRIPQTRYEPYLYTEAFHTADDAGDLQLMASAGLNVYFAPAIQLKLQYLHARFFDTLDFAVRGDQETETFLGAKLVMGL